MIIYYYYYFVYFIYKRNSSFVPFPEFDIWLCIASFFLGVGGDGVGKGQYCLLFVGCEYNILKIEGKCCQIYWDQIIVFLF